MSHSTVPSFLLNSTHSKKYSANCTFMLNPHSMECLLNFISSKNLIVSFHVNHRIFIFHGEELLDKLCENCSGKKFFLIFQVSLILILKPIMDSHLQVVALIDKNLLNEGITIRLSILSCGLK